MGQRHSSLMSPQGGCGLMLVSHASLQHSYLCLVMHLELMPTFSFSFSRPTLPYLFSYEWVECFFSVTNTESYTGHGQLPSLWGILWSQLSCFSAVLTACISSHRDLHMASHREPRGMSLAIWYPVVFTVPVVPIGRQEQGRKIIRGPMWLMQATGDCRCLLESLVMCNKESRA